MLKEKHGRHLPKPLEGAVPVDEHPVYLQLSEDERERRRKYREFARGMIKETESLTRNPA